MPVVSEAPPPAIFINRFAVFRSMSNPHRFGTPERRNLVQASRPGLGDRCELKARVVDGLDDENDAANGD